MGLLDGCFDSKGGTDKHELKTKKDGSFEKVHVKETEEGVGMQLKLIGKFISPSDVTVKGTVTWNGKAKNFPETKAGGQLDLGKVGKIEKKNTLKLEGMTNPPTADKVLKFEVGWSPCV